MTKDFVVCWTHWKYQVVLRRHYIRIPWFGWRAHGDQSIVDRGRWRRLIIGRCDQCRARLREELGEFIDKGQVLLGRLLPYKGGKR